MKNLTIALLAGAIMIITARAQTTAIAKYTTSESFDRAFLTSLRTVPLSEFTIKSSDKVQGTIQANKMDKLGRNEFSSLFILVTKGTNDVSIEATFTRNAGFMGGGKPADWAKKFGDKLKSDLLDLKIEITDPKKKKQ